MSAAYTSGFGQPACQDPREFGGKAAGLAGLAAAGLPVASGFAIGAAAYRDFLGESGLRAAVDALAGIPDSDRRGRDAAIAHIARQAEATPVPEAVATAIRERYRRLCDETGIADVDVAVRSSATAEDTATASFAGGFGTWVDVAGAEGVIAHVRRCWTSLFAAGAMGYARVHGLGAADVEMAVVVQKTVRARAAGVMFTISPVTGDRSRIVIEASWGLGLAVVGGEVTPDRWVVDKVRLTVAGCTPGDKRIEYRRGDAATGVDPARWAQPCLTGEQVIALARLGKQIESQRRCPQDIEFAVDRDSRSGAGLVLLQCRPETVWSTRPHVPRFDAGVGLTGWISGAVTGRGGSTSTTAPAAGLFVVSGGSGGVDTATGERPLHDARLELLEFPPWRVLGVVVAGARWLLIRIITHMAINGVKPADGCIRCLIYVRISMDKDHDGHGVANQLAKLEQKARERGWMVVYRLSDNDIGVTRKDPTKPGKYRPGYEEAMRLVDAGAVDAVLVFKWDRFIREPLDLEYLIPRFDKAGVRFAEVEGTIDLGTDSGRLAARILIAVAKAEAERKAERQKLANEQAAINGKRFTGCPRPFGYRDDHVTAHPAEGPAVAEACAAVLGGGTISGVLREWTAAGLVPPQQAQRGTPGWDRASIRTILLNPRIAGLSAYHGEVVGRGQWEPLVGEETWRAVRGILEDPARKPPRGVRTLLGGMACCPCGNVVTGMPSHRTYRIYRCTPATRNRDWTGGHVARQAEPVEEFIEKLVIARLSRADAAGLVSVGEAGVDVAALREEAAAIRANLEELAGDCALGRISRAQMLKATEKGNARLAEIGTELDHASRENVLAPLVAAGNAAAMWDGLDISRKRAVIKTLMSITLHSPGRGARGAFDPATVEVAWRQPDAA